MNPYFDENSFVLYEPAQTGTGFKVPSSTFSSAFVNDLRQDTYSNIRFVLRDSTLGLKVKVSI